MSRNHAVRWLIGVGIALGVAIASAAVWFWSLILGGVPS